MAYPQGRLPVLDVWRSDAAAQPEGGFVPTPEPVPRRKKDGTELIERALPYQLRARTSLQFSTDGVRCVIVVPLRKRGTSCD